MLDLLRMNLYSPDRLQVPLTSAEFTLLSVFCRRPQIVLSRETLLTLMHSQPAAVFDRAIDTLIARLRRKIEDDVREPTRIKTVRNGGYIFTPQVNAAPREILP
jgi:two-component system OmpR family response regulator